MEDPVSACIHCGRPAFWRGVDGVWHCRGCEYPEHWEEIRESLTLPQEDVGPYGPEEFAQRKALKLVNKGTNRVEHVPQWFPKASQAEDSRPRFSSWAEWKAHMLNRLFAELGTGGPGNITAETVRHGENARKGGTFVMRY